MTEFEKALLAEVGQLSRAVKCLGNADAHTPMGAIEAYSLLQRKGLDGIAEALLEVAEALGSVANAIEGVKGAEETP